MVRYAPCLFLLLCLNIFAQDQKTITAVRTSETPKIDGILDDEIWNSLPAYGNFFMYEPGN